MRRRARAFCASSPTVGIVYSRRASATSARVYEQLAGGDSRRGARLCGRRTCSPPPPPPPPPPPHPHSRRRRRRRRREKCCRVKLRARARKIALPRSLARSLTLVAGAHFVTRLLGELFDIEIVDHFCWLAGRRVLPLARHAIGLIDDRRLFAEFLSGACASRSRKLAACRRRSKIEDERANNTCNRTPFFSAPQARRCFATSI